jgi:hypothetical protein
MYTDKTWELREVIKCGGWNRSGGFAGTSGVVDQLLIDMREGKNDINLENRLEGEFQDDIPKDYSGIRSPGMMGWAGYYHPHLDLLKYMLSNMGILILTGGFSEPKGENDKSYLEPFRYIIGFQADLLHYKETTVALIHNKDISIVRVSGKEYDKVLEELHCKYVEFKEGFYKRLYKNDWQYKCNSQNIRIKKVATTLK